MAVYDIINPFHVSVGHVYLQHYLFFDSIIVFLLFLSLASFVFKNKYGEGREGKGVAIAVALALTFAFAVMELATGFNFGHPIMQGLAGLLLLLVFGILLYELLKMMFGDDHKKCAVAFTYFVIYGTLMSAFSPLYQSLYSQAPIVAAILSLGFLISIIAVVMCLIKMFGSFGGGSSATPTPHTHDGTHAPVEHHAEPQHPPADHSDPSASIVFPRSGMQFTEGETVSIIAEFGGGSGEYVWKWQPAPDKESAVQGKGKKQHIQEQFTFTAGSHRVTIAVADPRTGKSTGAFVDVVVAPVDISGVQHLIGEYEHGVQQFATLVGNFKLASDELIANTRAVFAGSGETEKLAKSVSEHNRISADLAKLSPALSELSKKIAKDPHVDRVHAEDEQRLVAAHSTYLHAATLLADVTNTFQEEYNTITP